MGTGSQLLPKQHSKIGLPSSSMHLFGKDFSEATSVKRPLLQNWDPELKFTLWLDSKHSYRVLDCESQAKALNTLESVFGTTLALTQAS